MNYSGYIEGYYGKLLSWKQREDLAHALRKHNLTHYLFAAKEDSYHRLQWRVIPNKGYTEQLTQFISTSKERDVTVIPAIAPGLSYSYTDEDYALLCERIDHFISCGAQEVTLLMDDIPAIAPTHTDNSLGTVHGKLVTALQNRFTMTPIHFCPTIYTDELINSTKTTQTYLRDLKHSLPESTILFWTGQETIAQSLSEGNLDTVLNHFDKRVIIWDNIYSNDYATSRLFVGPYENRSYDYLCQHTCGCMINPTGLPLTDTLLLDIFGQWQRGDTIQWHQTLRNHKVPENLIPFLMWCYTPFTTASLPRKISPMDFFTECIVNWDSELKREWYPFLHRIFVELRLIEGTTTQKPHWHSMRFLPYTAEKLIE